MPKGTGPHVIRHHYASLLSKHGESMKTVSERFGHTNAAMTLNVYTHVARLRGASEPGPTSTRRTRTSPPMPSDGSMKRRNRSPAR
ncbi:tyrosine-type recombinase/integrase [Streptomyces goshikiensis]|uniref:tyrosine-type recombinase/integrase n=1 Tax=Streptomyces TaxID=1883 RepID=UPI002277C6B9|nr:tyrosine-type recombinase/integrase [Streptomyces sp. CB02120-2]